MEGNVEPGSAKHLASRGRRSLLLLRGEASHRQKMIDQLHKSSGGLVFLRSAGDLGYSMSKFNWIQVRLHGEALRATVE
jgi:hypothetical protein